MHDDAFLQDYAEEFCTVSMLEGYVHLLRGIMLRCWWYLYMRDCAPDESYAANLYNVGESTHVLCVLPLI